MPLVYLSGSHRISRDCQQLAFHRPDSPVRDSKTPHAEARRGYTSSRYASASCATWDTRGGYRPGGVRLSAELTARSSPSDPPPKPEGMSENDQHCPMTGRGKVLPCGGPSVG